MCIRDSADYLAVVGTHFQVQPWLIHLQLVRTLLDAYFNRCAELVSPPPLISGKKLMEALNLPPGKLIGQLLEQIAEAQASGEISSAEEALELARRLCANASARN
ncbi:MAG: hypothetical protein J7551_07185, partial [Chloroflexi bacterium]|nr:hypothetical protein [Chloroflexota bacterium]